MVAENEKENDVGAPRVRTGLKSEIRELLAAARERGVLKERDLDRMLASLAPETFERDLALLVEETGILPIEPGSNSSSAAHPHDLPGNGRVSRRYLRDVERYPLMTREDEVAAAKRLEFTSERLAAAEYRPASVCAARRSEYQRYFNSFVENNLHIVVSEIYAYRTYQVALDDLVQEGNAALMHAVEKFDWRKGVRFRTYVTWWIRQAVERYMAGTKGAVRVPHHLQQKLRRLKRQGRLPDGFGQSTTVGDVASAFEFDHGHAGRLIESSRVSLSLEQEVDDGGERFRDLLADEWQPTDSDREGMLRNRIGHLLADLDERERTVLELRFGLDGHKARTLEEIGTTLHLSRERSRQIQQQALSKLRRLAGATSLELEL
jgi:RNA polymerase sigma factor (sigma-70 family)